MLDFLNYKLTIPALIGVIIGGYLLVSQVFYYIIVYGKLLSYFHKKKKESLQDNTPSTLQGVSIVLTTNNNAEALKERLIQILEQEYPLFEVIVVNENSTDDTEFILYVLKENYPNLTVINLQENANNFKNNKFSLAIGIRSAKYDYVLLTNVVCKPISYNWLSLMMQPINLDTNKKILSGICLREPSKGLTNILEQYDMATSYMNLIPYTLYGNAYTCCGYNMVYNKDFFIDNNGFIAQYSKSCQQEDYFVHRFSNKKNTGIVATKESVLYLPKYTNFKAFLSLKLSNSLSKKELYFKDKLLLSLLPINAFLFYLCCVGLIFVGLPWQYIVLSCVIKWIVQIIYYNKCTKQLNIHFLWPLTPLWEIIFFFINFVIRLKVLFHRQKRVKIKWD